MLTGITNRPTCDSKNNNYNIFCVTDNVSDIYVQFSCYRITRSPVEHMPIIHHESKKGAILTMAVTLSVLD